MTPPAGVMADQPTKSASPSVVGWDYLYPYTADLLCLDSCRPPGVPLPPELSTVSTPLAVPAWLRGYTILM